MSLKSYFENLLIFHFCIKRVYFKLYFDRTQYSRLLSGYCTVERHDNGIHKKRVMWIRIQSDPYHFGRDEDPDTDPGL